MPKMKNKTCGSCYAGICIMDGSEIQRCDDCALFETDDAIKAVDELLKVLHAEYTRRGGTVADAFDRIRKAVDRG